MSDEIRVLSEALAVDPASPVFVRLGELLRQRGDFEGAFRVVTRGLARHPQHVDAHDLVARIAVDRGDDVRAKWEWELVLKLSPGHAPSQKGLAFLAVRQGDLESGARHLGEAVAANPHDASLAAVLESVRARLASPAGAAPRDRPTRVITPPAGQLESLSPPFGPKAADSRALFADVVGNAARLALLLDRDGYVVAGGDLANPDDDRSAAVGAQLSGVSDEAYRTVRHLDLGHWKHIVFETVSANVAMAPAGDGLLLLAVPHTVPLGLLRRMLERSLDRARRWLESGT